MKTIEFTVEAAKIDDQPIIVEGKPANFEWFIRWILDSDSKFNNDAAGIKASAAIERSLETAIKDETNKITIDDIHYDRLKEAVLAPSAGAYPLRRGRLCLPWVQMVEDAK